MQPIDNSLNKNISIHNFKALYDLTKQMKSILTESKEEEDQKVIDLTDPTPFRIFEMELESQSMCDDCEVDNKEENESDFFHHETREEFAQVPVKVEATSYYRPKVRFERFEFFPGVFLVGLLVFLALIFNC